MAMTSNCTVKALTPLKILGVVLVLSASCMLLRHARGRETEHFLVNGDIPAANVDAIYEIFRERVLIPAAHEERIVVRIDRRLRGANWEGKTYPWHISLASYSDRAFIHELAHYLWEIRGWAPRPWLRAERSRLKSSHPLIKEELLNHYVIYDVITPKVEVLLKETAR